MLSEFLAGAEATLTNVASHVQSGAQGAVLVAAGHPGTEHRVRAKKAASATASAEDGIRSALQAALLQYSEARSLFARARDSEEYRSGDGEEGVTFEDLQLFEQLDGQYAARIDFLQDCLRRFCEGQPAPLVLSPTERHAANLLAAKDAGKAVAEVGEMVGQQAQQTAQSFRQQ
mmetsp:Transcript_9165/g.22012  ORF Transcript_9165/g.22012 Transcript_9165/m.22012 type:complete len:174 (+) Transcript_9165:34-555(+)